MSKLFLLVTLPLLCWCVKPTSTTIENQSENTVVVPTKAISELTPEEKAAFITHLKTTGSCEWKGHKLYGKVQFVSSFPDIKIQYVSSFPDLKVKFVSSFPDDCGEWQEVTSFPDLKVQVVSSFPDLKVQKVSSFPGMN